MKLKSGAHIHLMGICGTAMGSLAGLLKEQGFKVTGSDQNVYPPMSTQLESLGIEIRQGYRRENLEPKPDLVIVGNVISKHFEEAEALLASDIPYTSLPKAMGEFLIDQRNSIVMTGTHGKTTTTSMMVSVADACDKAPGYLVGGIPEDTGQSFRNPGESDWFVIEGDEYDTAFFDKVPKFVHYRPKYVVVTSIEFDHADIYKDLEQIKQSFIELVKLVPRDGLMVVHGDDPNVMDVVSGAQCKVVTYGLESGDYRAVDRTTEVGRNQFCVEQKGQRVADVAIKHFGPHNTLNALSVFALASELKWPRHQILQGLANFKGVKRRQEVFGEKEGVTYIEDFAHHPTAVRLTLQGLKERYVGRRVMAVFEPRSATSRRNTFQKDYAEAFQGADIAVIAQPFNQEKIPVEERFSSNQLVEDLKAAGVQAYVGDNKDALVRIINGEKKINDVIVVMSNGGFDGLYEQLLAD